jgi:hypothetical protein
VKTALYSTPLITGSHWLHVNCHKYQTYLSAASTSDGRPCRTDHYGRRLSQARSFRGGACCHYLDNLVEQPVKIHFENPLLKLDGNCDGDLIGEREVLAPRLQPPDRDSNEAHAEFHQ